MTLAENQVDIWTIDLERFQNAIQQCRRLLSPDEVERAHRFYFEKHRRRFIVARAATRQILSRYQGHAPQELVFCYGSKRKPELCAEMGKSGIRFNLSHSGEVALLAVTPGLAVGVDIELVDPEFATQEIAQHFFSAGEVRHLKALSPHESVDAFFACWTRKEAYIKALGQGLSVPLDSFEVAFGPGAEPDLLVRVDSDEITCWTMYDIETAKEHRAALVVEGRGHQLRRLQCAPDLLP